MRRLLVLLMAISYMPVYASFIEIKGAYQGENIYVKNPFAAVGVGFCVFEVTVNGMTTTDEINSSAFEIDLAVYGFRLGDPVVVRINHKDGCTPRVLNRDVLSPRATFEVEDLRVNGERITWTSRNESGSLPFVVEQFRWNKWVAVGEVVGKGVPGTHTYTLPVRPHGGENRFRIRQTDHTRNHKYSPEVVYRTNRQPVRFSVTSDGSDISFTDNTMYELYDGFGRIVVKGYGDRIHISGLQRGRYYLNFDNQMEVFIKR